MAPIRPILATLRPRQWVKNAFAVAPLVFAKRMLEPDLALQSGLAVAAFCALSGTVYAINDLADVEQDRLHPVKRHRPIASGALSIAAARVLSLVTAVGGLALCLYLSWETLFVGAGYLALNLAYSFRLKHIAFVDVGCIATGFLLRVWGGAFAIDVPVSGWLLMCTALLAMLLGFGKRAHELRRAERSDRDAKATRAALAGYKIESLRWALYLLAAATCSAYGLYTVDAHTVTAFGTSQLLWTTPFCVVGIGRFLSLALASDRDDSPTDRMLRDPAFMANILAWGAVVLVIIYAS